MSALKKVAEPTTEQLQLAFRHLARPGWPNTLEEALQDRRVGGLVRGLARSLNRVKAKAAPAQPQPAWAPTAIRPRLSHEMAHFDAKRAAANDRED